MPATGGPALLGPLGLAAGITAAAVGAMIRLRNRDVSEEEK
jgi:hypothetical protein